MTARLLEPIEVLADPIPDKPCEGSGCRTELRAEWETEKGCGCIINLCNPCMEYDSAGFQKTLARASAAKRDMTYICFLCKARFQVFGFSDMYVRITPIGW